MQRELIELEVNDITVKLRPRTDDGDLHTLENSISHIGLLHPIVVDQDNILISGGRRLQACRNAGIASVPAIKLPVKYDSIGALTIQGDENLCRKKLTTQEVEKHIELKKSATSQNQADDSSGIISGIKKFFSGD